MDGDDHAHARRSRQPPAAGSPVSVDPRVTAARTRFPLLANALERHLGWARDFVIAGDVDSAVDAIRDASATFAELRAADASGGASATNA